MFKLKELTKWESGVGPYTHIVWHHSLTEDGETLNDFEAIKRYHKNHWRWRDIGYNIVIERDGPEGKVVAKWGRPLGVSGAHCKENRRNYTSVGICFVGNYDIGSGEILSAEHFEVAKEVVTALEKELGILVHERHSDHATYKSCPGSAFPFDALVDYVSTIKVQEVLHYDDVDGTAWSADAVITMINKSIMVGDGNKFRPKDNITREELAQVIYNLLNELGKL